jgi:Na+/H+ antiporter NhaA
VLQEEVKLGILGGSLVAGLIGAVLLRFAGASRHVAKVAG